MPIHVTMGKHLDLDDLTADHPQARRELEQLRAYADALNARCVADAPDAERYRWLSARMLAADFDYFGVQALVFKMPSGFAASADCDATIDAAMVASAGITAGREGRRPETVRLSEG